ncbi:cathepsin D [Malassezia cuniculi]|uniref:Cathepsin D n=1 Tax=Malassezia cuniculi TaxID=948313 RepID=A0AAF0EX02_9BASI|nr:cathepsin D [Malassezia cuniculi]
MKYSVAFVAGLICASGAAASASFEVPLQRRGGQSIDITNLRFKTVISQIDYTVSKYTRAAENYKRNTGKDHPLIKKSNTKRNNVKVNATVPLKDVEHELEWVGNITIGGQEMLVDYDTGSGDLIINPEAYSPQKSNTSVTTGDSFSAAYADGTSGDGKIFIDNVGLGNSIVAKNVSIGRADKRYIVPEDEGGNQGIAGLSFPSITAFGSNHTSLVSAIANNSNAAAPIFQFNLKAGEGSTLHIGDVDESKVSGNITYVDVNPRIGFWLTEAKIKGSIISAIIDSGTTLIIGPEVEVLKVFHAVGGIETFTQSGTLYGAYDCDRDLKLSFTIGGTNYSIPKSLQSWGQTSDGRCVVSINGQPSLPFHAWVVGDVFFQNRTIIFDAAKNRLGFADAK